MVNNGYVQMLDVTLELGKGNRDNDQKTRC